jgi:hypothetical protein
LAKSYVNSLQYCFAEREVACDTQVNGMEPFQLSLNQVNFEHYQLGEEQDSEEPLHSFSNLVCYDLDFKSDEGGGIPIKTKKVVRIDGKQKIGDFPRIISPFLALLFSSVKFKILLKLLTVVRTTC